MWIRLHGHAVTTFSIEVLRRHAGSSSYSRQNTARLQKPYKSYLLKARDGRFKDATMR